MQVFLGKLKGIITRVSAPSLFVIEDVSFASFSGQAEGDCYQA